MNKLSPKKLLHSKWSALNPVNREKHFMVTEVEFDEEKRLIRCVVQAVLTKREFEIDWREFKDASVWRLGWV